MQRITAAIAAAAAIFAAAPAAATALVDVAVISRATGQRIPVYSHAGRLYVPGTPGERYTVYVANRTGERVMTVVSVDGINVVTGETASPDQNGYVLAPGQSFEINGWRKSMNEVAAFYFTRLPDSYAARTGRPHHVGVIGVAAFREWQRPHPVPQPVAPLSRREASAAESGKYAQADAAGAPAANAPDGASAQEAPRARGEREAKIGTGHGGRERSEVVHTSFRRASPHPAQTLTIYYDTHANLVARGIIPGPTPVGVPNPFPAGRFVPDPRG
jgi:hypothetical protein